MVTPTRRSNGPGNGGAATPAATPTQPAAQPSLLDEVIERSVDQLAAASDRYYKAITDSGQNALRRSMILAAGLEVLEAALTDQLLGRFIRLMNTDLGFLTDRPPNSDAERKYGVYRPEVIKRVIITGLLRGVMPLFNEFNIISGRLYITSAGWQKKCRELVGLTDLQVATGTPVLHNGQTVVRCGARWKFNGVDGVLWGADGKIGRVYPIIVNKGASPDNIVGKARAKAFRDVFNAVTGTVFTEDFDAEETAELLPQAAAEAKSLAERLEERAHDQVSDAPNDEQHANQCGPEVPRQPGEE